MSRIIIYNTKLSPELNAQVDNIQDYLNSLQATLDKDVQYQKVELDLSIKVDLPQEYQTKTIGNYVDLIQDNKHFYFFIMGAAWTAKNTVTLQLSLDTINTFNGDFTFTDKTHIIREHRNRFSKVVKEQLAPRVTRYKLLERVDEVAEGITGAVQFKTYDEQVYSNNNPFMQSWYIAYKKIIISEGESKIEVSLFPKTPVVYSYESTDIFRVYGQDYDASKVYSCILGNDDNTTNMYMQVVALSKTRTYRIGDDTGYGPIVGFQWRRVGNEQHPGLEAYVIIRDDYRGYGYTTLEVPGDTLRIDLFNARAYRTGPYSDDGWEANPGIIVDFPRTALPEPTQNETYTGSIDDVDVSDKTYIKIIECPYCPIEINYDEQGHLVPVDSKWSISDADKIFKYNDYTHIPEFEREIVEKQSLGLLTEFEARESSLPYVTRGLYFADPKLKNSSFFTYKLSYDNFSISIPFEYLKPTVSIVEKEPVVSISYKQSNNISSSLVFKTNVEGCNYQQTGDYSNYLVSTRSLEKALLTDEYMEYIKNGYNYDRKQQNMQLGVSTLSATVSIIGGMVSTLAGGATGGISAVAGVALLGQGINTMANTISNAVNAEANIEEKINNLQNQGLTVSGCDDLNLLNYYNGNKLHIINYSVSDNIKSLLSNLFYNFGYATDKYAIPNTTSRIWFNYIQCEPVFEEERTSVYQDFLKDIKTRYATGVTVYHKYNDEYHFDKTYENWETNIIG